MVVNVASSLITYTITRQMKLIDAELLIHWMSYHLNVIVHQLGLRIPEQESKIIYSL
jgi:hypothetical protein